VDDRNRPAEHRQASLAVQSAVSVDGGHHADRGWRGCSSETWAATSIRSMPGRAGKLWSTDLGGAIAGGVISYDTGAGQRVAVAAGMTSPNLADAEDKWQGGRLGTLTRAS